VSIEVVKPGMLSQVQDQGRRGFRQYGVVESGAMDSFALHVANILLANEHSAAALEITLLGPELLFHAPTVIALCGGECELSLNGKTIKQWQPVFVSQGDCLTVGRVSKGCRVYLAVKGGIDVPLVMDSRSTYMRAATGGYQGRCLKVGDTLPCSTYVWESALEHKTPEDLGSHLGTYCGSGQGIRVLPGNHWDWFTDESQQAFLSCSFKVSTEADRMAYRLTSDMDTLLRCREKQDAEVITEGVCPGTIQVPANGRPIVLTADCQTTGGYPKIAQVISVDMPKLAQLKPGDAVSFVETDLKTAHNLMHQQHRSLAQLEARMTNFWEQ